MVLYIHINSFFLLQLSHYQFQNPFVVISHWLWIKKNNANERYDIYNRVKHGICLNWVWGSTYFVLLLILYHLWNIVEILPISCTDYQHACHENRRNTLALIVLGIAQLHIDISKSGLSVICCPWQVQTNTKRRQKGHWGHLRGLWWQ